MHAFPLISIPVGQLYCALHKYLLAVFSAFYIADPVSLIVWRHAPLFITLLWLPFHPLTDTLLLKCPFLIVLICQSAHKESLLSVDLAGLKGA